MNTVTIAASVAFLVLGGGSESTALGGGRTGAIPQDSSWAWHTDSIRYGTFQPDVRSASPDRMIFYMAGTAAITAGLIHFDQQTYTTLLQWKRRSASLESVSPAITTVGNGVFSVGLFGGYLGYGMLSDNSRATCIGKIGLESFAASGMAVQLLKLMFGRERPSVATRPGGKWSGPFSYFRRNAARSNGIASFDAFPSGHTTTVFAAATTLADAYASPWVGRVSYTIASGVAISRIMEGTHWMSDCFVGGLIGILSARSVEKLNELPLSVAVEPLESGKTVGVRLVLMR